MEGCFFDHVLLCSSYSFEAPDACGERNLIQLLNSCIILECKCSTSHMNAKYLCKCAKHSTKLSLFKLTRTKYSWGALSKLFLFGSTGLEIPLGNSELILLEMKIGDSCIFRPVTCCADVLFKVWIYMQSFPQRVTFMWDLSCSRKS